MNAQSVTVHLPSDILLRLRKQARAMQHSIDEEIKEALLDYWSENSPWSENSDEESDLFVIEENTFRANHKVWWEQYANQYVALLGTELVDHDPDLESLTQRLYKRYGDQPIWVAPVRENPVEEWAMRSPRFQHPTS